MLNIILMSETPIAAIKMGKGKDYDEFKIENYSSLKYVAENKIILTVNED